MNENKKNAVMHHRMEERLASTTDSFEKLLYQKLAANIQDQVLGLDCAKVSYSWSLDVDIQISAECEQKAVERYLLATVTDIQTTRAQVQALLSMDFAVPVPLQAASLGSPLSNEEVTALLSAASATEASPNRRRSPFY